MVRKLSLKNLPVERNWNTGNTISYNFKAEFVSSARESPAYLDLTEATCIIVLSSLSRPWNRTSRANPQTKWYSFGSSWTILYPENKSPFDADSFSSEGPWTPLSTGTASRATACKITGHASSRHCCNFAETRDDWIPSRNGFHCRQWYQTYVNNQWQTLEYVLSEEIMWRSSNIGLHHFYFEGGSRRSCSPLRYISSTSLVNLNFLKTMVTVLGIHLESHYVASSRKHNNNIWERHEQ